MMRWIVGSSLKFRYLVVAARRAMMVVRLGAAAGLPGRRLPGVRPAEGRDPDPDLGLSAEETEELVTVPMEQALNGAARASTTIRSKSVPALSPIVLIFERGTDLLKARQLVAGAHRDGHADAARPGRAPPVMIQPLSSTSRVMKIGLTSKTVSLIEMSMIAYWKIRARLLRVPGVANVAIWGERLQMLQVQVDPERLRAARRLARRRSWRPPPTRSTPGCCSSRDGSVIGTGGFIETPNQRLNVQHVLPIVDARRPGAGADRGAATGRPRAPRATSPTLVEDHQPLIGDAVINDGPGLMLIVEKLPWANTLEVTRGVEEALEELQPGLPGIEIDTTIFRPATLHRDVDRQPHERAAHRLRCSSSSCSRFFLFEWRAALISLITIPLSLDRRRARALPARHDDQHDDPGGLRDRPRRGGRRRDHRRREHRPPPAPAPAPRAARSRPPRSSSRPRSRCGARSSTRR